jgi:hypothetical protein
LTASEKSLLHNYVNSNDFQTTNDKLRAGKKDTLGAKVKKIIHEKGTTLEKPTVLFRGVDRSQFRNARPGDEIHDPGLVSTSFSAKATSAFGSKRIAILAPKGTKGIGGGKEEEHEFILPGAHFRVRDPKTVPGLSKKDLVLELINT